MWRSVASNGLTILIVLILTLGALVSWGQRQYRGPGPLTQAICLKVDRGQSMRTVSGTLKNDGAITNESIFRTGADYSGKSGLLKAGSFLVPEQASMEMIVEIITRGGQSTCGIEVNYRIGVATSALEVRELDPATNRFVEVAAFAPGPDAVIPDAYTRARGEADARYRVILAEGVTSWQVVQELNAADFLDGKVTKIPDEGMLSPDSYEVRAGDSRAELLAKMEEAQTKILADAWDKRNRDVPLKTPQEALILASIIEKETGVAQERKIVASVFENRLNKGMKLQTDPTVIYGVTGGKGILGRGLRQSELRRDTPWNTYLITGLPKTPIANPGRASIEAALNPADTKFIFFVADGTGGHAFAETLAQHNANVAKWRKLGADQTKP